MARPATFPVARVNVLSVGLRIRDVTEVFLFVDLGDGPEGFADGRRQCMWAGPSVRSETQRVRGGKRI